MSERRILTVGCELASSSVPSVDIDTKTSLLDWDIVLFKPDIRQFVATYDDDYKGKPCLSDSRSFQLKECCAHWRREILQASEAGKTIVVFLTELVEVFVDTGQRTYSGTGRSQKTTRHVGEYSNYESIPATLGAVATTGTSMKLSARASEVLAPYWREFESVSRYNVVLTNVKVPASIVTRVGDKPVGAIYRSKGGGTLLLLPDVDFNEEDSFEKEDESTWTSAERNLASRLIASVRSLDDALRSSAEITPEPGWAADPAFALGSEGELRVQLLEAESTLEVAQKRKEQVAEQLKAAGALRGLLYEKGKPLERVIIEALRVLGFTAAPYRDSASEFDVVFESAEGRLIGEAEGKDNKAVGIDKLRQLALNIHEDLQREEVTDPAKPVLFGNGFRLAPLTERADPFTDKCRSAATTTSTALVFTPDLFRAAQYLANGPDEAFAWSCRQVMLTTIGKVTFPAPPSSASAEDATKVEVAKYSR